jgi:hypothetical protein
MTTKLSDLPPTRGIPLPSEIERLQQDALAFRILLAAAVWKTGGTLTITHEDLVYVAIHCKLDQRPIDGGQVLTVNVPGLILPPEVGNA